LILQNQKVVAYKIRPRKGASKEEIMEAVWVAAEMRAGAAYSHATISMNEMEKY